MALAATLDHHPDPDPPPATAGGTPRIGLLLVDATAHRRGHGRTLAGLIEDRYRAAGRAAVRIAVLDANPGALAFWQSQGYRPLRHGTDREHGRPCTVLRKPLHAAQ